MSKRAAWDRAKVQRCPKYAELLQLRKDNVRLRESAKYHQDMLEKREKQLLDTLDKIRMLSAECRGR